MAERPELRHAGPNDVNREAELERPSRVACSDSLAHITFPSLRGHHFFRSWEKALQFSPVPEITLLFHLLVLKVFLLGLLEGVSVHRLCFEYLQWVKIFKMVGLRLPSHRLGEGGFGEIWLGRHQTMKECRAFKVLLPRRPRPITQA